MFPSEFFCRLFYKAFERSGQFGKAVDARNRLLDRSHTVRGVDKGNLRLLAGVVIPLGVSDIDRPGDLVLFHQQADVAALAKTGQVKSTKQSPRPETCKKVWMYPSWQLLTIYKGWFCASWRSTCGTCG